MQNSQELDVLLSRIRRCHICEDYLPLGPRPVLRAQKSARLLIVGQAPGTKVHASGTPWDDPSGHRLRHWLGIDKDKFYDQSKIAIVPVGFCYPGRLPKGGDRPPRPECAPLWHPPLMRLLLNVELTILAGTYAQKQFLGIRRGKSLTETVQAWRIYGPDFIPLPHPSWRTVGWQRRNPWFNSEVLPDLRRRVGRLVR